MVVNKYTEKYFYATIIKVLQEMGGAGNISEVTDRVVEALAIPEEELGMLENLKTMLSGTQSKNC